MRNKNPFTRLGRPPGSKNKTGIMDTAVPAKAFRGSGAATGYKRTAAHADDARMGKGSTEMGFASADQHFNRLKSTGRN